MSLNTYTEEVRNFLCKIAPADESNQRKIEWLGEEFQQLKEAVEASDMPKMQHQIYDMLFILFELTAANDLDLDSEWAFGAKRKAEKYICQKAPG
jgi:hypothetical protein